MERKRLKYIAKTVKAVLEDDPYTRNNDPLLYLKVCAIMNPKVLEKEFVDVMCNLDEYNLPTFESVSRSRRRLQELHEELAANEFTQKARAEQEKEYKAFARGQV